MNKIYLFLCVLIFSGHSLATDKSAIVYDDLKELEMQEIGFVIKDFLPSLNSPPILYWDYKANDESIIWLHKPYIEETLDNGSTEIVRKGVFRGNVKGVVATYLVDKSYQVPWSVLYVGSMAKFGVREIQFHPNLPTTDSIWSSECFGDQYRDCGFDPMPSLKDAGVHSEMVCKNGDDMNFEKVYLLTANGKRPTYAIHFRSYGSGGTNSSLQLILKTTKNDICNSIKN